MNEERFLQAVYEYGAQKHSGQYRKDGKTPYITHPYRVSKIAAKYGAGVVEQASAILHDVIEDTGTSVRQLNDDLFNIVRSVHDNKVSDTDAAIIRKIVKCVDDVSDKYTSQNYPEFNRGKRKRLELQRFVKDFDQSSTIVKLADIIDNLSSIEQLDVGFAEKYIFEDFMIIRAIKINHPIYNEAVNVFHQAIDKLFNK